jgi:hypothetical protein
LSGSMKIIRTGTLTLIFCFFIFISYAMGASSRGQTEIRILTVSTNAPHPTDVFKSITHLNHSVNFMSLLYNVNGMLDVHGALL